MPRTGRSRRWVSGEDGYLFGPMKRTKSEASKRLVGVSGGRRARRWSQGLRGRVWLGADRELLAWCGERAESRENRTGGSRRAVLESAQMERRRFRAAAVGGVEVGVGGGKGKQAKRERKHGGDGPLYTSGCCLAKPARAGWRGLACAPL